MIIRVGRIFVAVIAAFCIFKAQAANSVVNGDFSAGNNSFTSGYTFVAPAPGAMVPPSVYTITPNMRAPIDLHSQATAYFDHTTGNASGLFMAVNGSTVSNTVVWEQLIPGITPGADYFFSTWVSSWIAGSPALLQFSVNGTLLGAPFSAPAGTAVWQAFEATWNSGINTSATISIVNLNVAFGGNDYALDDIALTQQSIFNPVPEPDTYAMLLAGLGLLGFMAGRRKQKAA